MTSLLTECYRKLTDSSSNQQPLKGYKVTNVNRTRKVGVACRNLTELKKKACAKLNITDDFSGIGIFLLDGSEIDEDYFSTLEPQTTVILRRPGEKLLTEADVLYQMLRRVNESIFQSEEIGEKPLTDKLKAKIGLLHRALNRLDDSKTKLSSREQHPEWFDGLETRVQTKEVYLHRRCQYRIRGYLYKAIEHIRSSDEYVLDAAARKRLQHVIAYFKLQLKKDHFFGFYFDRSLAAGSAEESANSDYSRDGDETDALEEFDCNYPNCPCKMSFPSYERYIFGLEDEDEEENDNDDDDNDENDDNDSDEIDAKKLKMTPKKDRENKLDCSDKEELQEAEAMCPYKLITRRKKDIKAMCDVTGEFRCDGVWNRDACLFADEHRINPYRSKEDLILFSSWNLDHKIERSRTIVPQLLEASRNDELNEKKVMEFYDNLFTVKNLRLVHIVCHDKGSHK